MAVLNCDFRISALECFTCKLMFPISMPCSPPYPTVRKRDKLKHDMGDVWTLTLSIER